MSFLSEAIGPQGLPSVPSLGSSERQANVIMVLSSSSEDELPDVPLLHRLHVPAARLECHRSTSSRDASTKPLEGAPQYPPEQRSWSHEHPGRPLLAASSSSSSSDAAKVPQPEKRKKMDVVTVHIDPVLLQDGSGGLVLSALQAQGTPCVIQSQPVPRSITWSRSGVNIDGDVFRQEDDAEILVLVPVEDFVAMIMNHKTGAGYNNVTLSSFVANIVANKSCAIPTLVVMELEKYFKNQKTKDRKKLQEVVRGEAAKDKGYKRKLKGEPQHLSRVDVEEALMVLQLYKDVYVWFLETGKEFLDFVCMFSKAMAEAPTKRERDNSSFSFYLDGDWAKGVKVERCGKGLLEVWKKQMQQFNRVSVEVASTVVAVYPSPQLLVKAYHHCKTDAERHNLLSDILVRRGEGVTSTSRRVGPELSKRIYLQFMSSEPELSLDL